MASVLKRLMLSHRGSRLRDQHGSSKEQRASKMHHRVQKMVAQKTMLATILSRGPSSLCPPLKTKTIKQIFSLRLPTTNAVVSPLLHRRPSMLMTPSIPHLTLPQLQYYRLIASSHLGHPLPLPSLHLQPLRSKLQLAQLSSYRHTPPPTRPHVRSQTHFPHSDEARNSFQAAWQTRFVVG